MDLSLLFIPIVISLSSAIQALPIQPFLEAPQYRNAAQCPDATSACDPSLIHVTMTLDAAYIRGTMAAVHSILMHASCPQSIFFHFIASPHRENLISLSSVLLRSFPNLPFKIYPFIQESEVARLISPSLRKALDKPLNYARNQIPNLLPCVKRTIYLDSDVILVDDIKNLWEIESNSTIAAPEYCNADFTRYFTEKFWGNPEYRRTFKNRKNPNPCYFNTGVMVMNLENWRAGDYDSRIKSWMEVQRRERIYELGSLPPLMLVFAGDVHGVDHRWNQHGLGGDNASGNCRDLHPGAVSLMHWSGKGKPWDRIDAGKPCPVDFVWMQYDLIRKER